MSHNQDKGRLAETWAVWWLRLKGYRIVCRGYTGPRGRGMGEVDIIARRGRVLAFVEVKARPNRDLAQYAIQTRQQNRICRSAQAFLAQNPHYADCHIRFDAILICPGQWPYHLPNAWQASCDDR